MGQLAKVFVDQPRLTFGKRAYDHDVWVFGVSSMFFLGDQREIGHVIPREKRIIMRSVPVFTTQNK